MRYPLIVQGVASNMQVNTSYRDSLIASLYFFTGFLHPVFIGRPPAFFTNSA